jgi:putative ABC transport system permease protein
MNIVVRTTSNPLEMVNSIRKTVLSIDKDLPITNVKTLDQLLSDSVAPSRFISMLLAFFAALALILACMGIYGVISCGVTERTREIGIRMALGAQSRQVLAMVIKQGLIMVLIGIAVGLFASLGLTRLISSLLFDVSTIDPATFIGIPVLLTIVSLLACLIPALRAAKVDPMIALRYE